MNVGIRELKARLSELVERASEGETIRITDRGKPKAELRPLSTQAIVEQGVAEGWLTPSKRPGGVRGSRRRYKATITTEEALNEVRGD